MKRLLVGVSILALSALALSPGTARADNSILGQGSGDVLLRADEVVYDVNNSVVTAHGHVEIDYNDRILLADKVTYDQKTDTVTASGHITMMAPNGDTAFANDVTLTDQMRDGVLNDFAALLGENGRLAGVRATRTNGVRTVAERAAFTPCKICNKPGQRTPLWQVKAYRVIYDQDQHKISYNDAILELFGVPVFYTPYLSHPDPTVKHQSGILAPDFGSSSSLGTFVRVPVYFALTDSRDLTIAPMYTAQSGDVLQGEYRERWNDGGLWLQASIANDPKGGLLHNHNEWYSSFFGSGRIPLVENWRVGFDAALTSNDTYLKRYDISQEDRLVSDLFLEGVSGRSRFSMTGYFFQGLRATDVPSNMPMVLPLLEYSYVPERTWFGGQFRFDLNGASVSRDIGPDSQRLTAETRWRLPFVTDAGMLFTIQADARGDVYRVTNNDPVNFPNIPVKEHYISRGLPYLGIDWRWPFITGGGPNKTAFIIEPIVQLVAASYGGNPKGLPNEDSTDFELDETDIFRFDRVPGYDVWEPGPRATAGIRSEALFTGGSVELLVGESFRPKPIKTFLTNAGIEHEKSDLVGRLTIKFPPHFSLTHRVDIDQTDGSIRRNEVYVDANYGRSSMTLSYLRLNQNEASLGLNPREEVNGEATVAVTHNWLLFAGARRDIEASQMLDTEYGVGYDDECLGISLSFRRKFKRDRDVPPSSTFLLRIRLKTHDDGDEGAARLFPRHIFTTP
ncbi:MAG: LPS-assembly protein LptD [Proteobacteria bacterium]|nr:LPS-assembly protein LptD [Pseudomonadota bacterium]